VFLCTYCLHEKPDPQRSVEHVVGAALGGAWTVRDVCRVCQEDMGREVDQPFSQMLWVREQRHRHRIPDRYRHVPDAPKVHGTVEDGRGGRLTLVREGGWQLRVLPSIEPLEDGSINLRISADDEPEYLEKKLARLQKANPGFRYEVGTRTISKAAAETFSFDFSISQRLWPRFAIKVALNVGREVYGQDWLTTPHAMLLHEILWDRDTQTVMKPLPTRDVLWKRSGWSAVPNHVVMAVNTPWGPFLNLALFGEDTYGVPLGDQSIQKETVWLLHTHEERCECLSTNDFWMRVIVESQSQPEEGEENDA
jgi:hypothetical protein